MTELTTQIWNWLDVQPKAQSKRAIARNIKASRELVYKTVDLMVIGGHLLTTTAPLSRPKRNRAPQPRFKASPSKPLPRTLTRDECRQGPRPCPYRTCRYNLEGDCSLDHLEKTEKTVYPWQQIRKSIQIRPLMTVSAARQALLVVVQSPEKPATPATPETSNTA